MAYENKIRSKKERKQKKENSIQCREEENWKKERKQKKENNIQGREKQN